MGFAKKQAIEFVPSFGDGVLMEIFLGVLNIFVPMLQIPTYLGSRGVLLLYARFFQYSSAGEYEFVCQICTAEASEYFKLIDNAQAYLCEVL